MIKAKFSVNYCILFCVCLALVFSACGSSPDAGEKGRAAADKSRPVWVNSIDSVYSNNQYVAAVGTGNNRPAAEKNAFGNLISIFGQSIQVDEKISVSYQEAVKSGVTEGWTQNTGVENTIATSASMDTLVGAEIKEYWFDVSTNTHYAAAVMEKTTAARLYADMIKSNLDMINNLTAMSQAEKNTLEGFSRYQFAAMVADINVSYENLLKFIGAAPPAGVKNGHDYRMEAENIARAIPVTVTVTGDRQGRIQGALAKALAEMGFRSGGANSRYKVEASLNISEVQLQNLQGFKYARYELIAELVDTSTARVVLVPYSINDRQGHASLSEAENRALAAAEKKIGEEYRDELNDYLSRMLPKK